MKDEPILLAYKTGERREVFIILHFAEACRQIFRLSLKIPTLLHFFITYNVPSLLVFLLYICQEEALQRLQNCSF